MATVWIDEREVKKGKSYIVYYRDPYTLKNAHYRTFKKKREASQAANDLRTLIDSGKLPEKKKKFRPMTFEQVGESLKKKWDERLLEESLREKTVEDYKIWLNVLNRRFGSSLLMEITKDEIKAYRNEVKETLSLITSNRQLTVIKSVFRHGLELGAIYEDPIEKVKILDEKKYRRKYRLTLHQTHPSRIVQLVEASQQTKAKYYMPALIYLAAEHGASKDELLILKWSNINFDFEGHGWIRFFREKNMMDREVPLMPRSREALLRWKEHQEWIRKRKKIVANDSDLVFCHHDGSPRKSFRSAWRNTRQFAGVEKDFHFHDLRHLYTRSIKRAGGDIQDQQEMIGHHDISSTLIYSGMSTDQMLALNKNLEAYYNGTLE
jgi:site-specific recombinase XerD